MADSDAPPPQDGTPFYAIIRIPIRIPMKWKPYKPTSEQYKRGLKGRWMESNGYGGWNVSNYEPGQWEPMP